MWTDRFKATQTRGCLNIPSKSFHFWSQHQSRFGSLPSFQLWIKPTIQLISFIGEKHSSDFWEKHRANTFGFWCFDTSSEERRSQSKDMLKIICVARSIFCSLTGKKLHIKEMLICAHFGSDQRYEV